MKRSGFTLIELSIVLVIIGLIVGGVLVGRDLINAATLRSQISQIEKYTTAANTFRLKYGSLPGDITEPTATNFGLISRLGTQSYGDNNGVLQGLATASIFSGYHIQGELMLFWEDLASANLIDGRFNQATPSIPFQPITETSSPSINSYYPKAKVAGGYVYVWSGGVGAGTFSAGGTSGNGFNYFGVTDITSITNGGNIPANSAFTPQEAFSMDIKMDDGLPQTGKTTASGVNGGAVWVGASGTSATPASSSTCYDNGNATGVAQSYTVSQTNMNCSLSFRF